MERSESHQKTSRKTISHQEMVVQASYLTVQLPPPKHVNRPLYEVKIPNQMHQFDLLYMPSDTLYRNKFKYILSGIDAASRYKVARPLRTKQARVVAEMIAEIYKVGPLTYPKIFQCDKGSEFKGEVARFLEKHKVKILRVTMKYKHLSKLQIRFLQSNYSRSKMHKS